MRNRNVMTVADKTYTFDEFPRIKDAPLKLMDINLDWKIEKLFHY